MDISLPPEWQKFVDSQLASGDYHSPSEVIQRGLEMLAEQEKEQQIAHLNAEIAKGLKSLEEGKGIPGDVVYRQLMERIAEYEK